MALSRVFTCLALPSLFEDYDFVFTKKVKVILEHGNTHHCTFLKKNLCLFKPNWSFAEKNFVKQSMMLEWKKLSQNRLFYPESTLRRGQIGLRVKWAEGKM